MSYAGTCPPMVVLYVLPHSVSAAWDIHLGTYYLRQSSQSTHGSLLVLWLHCSLVFGLHLSCECVTCGWWTWAVHTWYQCPPSHPLASFLCQWDIRWPPWYRCWYPRSSSCYSADFLQLALLCVGIWLWLISLWPLVTLCFRDLQVLVAILNICSAALWLPEPISSNQLNLLRNHLSHVLIILSAMMPDRRWDNFS